MRNHAFSNTIHKLTRTKVCVNTAEGPVTPRPRRYLATDKQAAEVYNSQFKDLDYPKSSIVKGIYDTYRLDLSQSPISDKLAMFKPSFNGDTELRFNDGTKIVDQGRLITVSSPSSIAAEDRAFLVVTLAKSKGWSGMAVQGTSDYVLACWMECLKQGIKISVRPEQRALYEKFMNIKPKNDGLEQPKPPAQHKSLTI